MSHNSELIKQHMETKQANKPTRRLKLQKVDEDTNDLIDNFRAFLFSIGYRGATREKAWEILQKAHRLPYEVLVEKNKDGIEYQGQGRHISSKHGNQLMVIKELGRYEVKAVSDRSKEKDYNATIRFRPSQDMKTFIRESIPVVSENND